MPSDELTPDQAQQRLMDQRRSLAINPESTPPSLVAEALGPVLQKVVSRGDQGDWEVVYQARIQAEWESSLRTKLLASGVPRRFLDASLDHFHADVRDQVVGQEGLFITGPAGTGKTHLAAAILREMLRVPTDRKARMIGVPDLMLTLQASFRDQAPRAQDEIIDDLASASILVLDDLGAEKASEYTTQALYVLINRRYGNERQTIITSNLGLDEIAMHCSDRIASRIAGMCRVVTLTGPDRRVGRFSPGV